VPRRLPGEGLIVAFGLAFAGDAARGADLARLAGCASCHTAPGGLPFAGGHAIETSFGTFYGPNITPGGIGAFDERDFVRAMHGRSPRGHRYYPAFPWTSYRDLTSDDLSDLWAFMRTIPASDAPSRRHQIRGLYGWRFLLTFWNPNEAPPPPAGAERGAYLANAVLHCTECHTPRSMLGSLRPWRWLQGNDAPPEPAPDLTHLGWTASEWDDFLTSAMTPDGDVIGGEMSRIVEEGTATLSPEDRAALIGYVSAIHGPR
jgi:mono/diheme cytochrome c family protein